MNWDTNNYNITIHVLLNTSKSKGIQTMNFGQLIEWNMRNFFTKNNTQNVLEKLFLRPFFKKSKLSISLDQHSEFF